ncbi:ParB N-terminal domain-containing protein [Pararhizobium sp. A13]|uniref:ParB N-terminal domain-containing protein n=1 Tax=Pararhizobium sp. A13 TaxID=3133975 RepID=UPI00324F832A
MASFKSLPLSDIFVGERARPVDEDHAQAIAASMAERGLINPITVRATSARKGTPYTLVAGGHRLRAAAINGWGEIDTILVSADETEAQLMEISENLYRNELSKLDRAIFVLKFREMWEEKNGRINPQGGRPSGKQDHDDPVIFAAGRELSERVCERLGISAPSFKRVNRIGQNLHADLRHMVRGTPIADDQTQLLKLAKMPLEEQVRIAAALRHEPDLKKVLALTKPAVASLTAEQQQAEIMKKLVALWEKADAGTRRSFLDHIGDQDDLSFLEAAQ